MAISPIALYDAGYLKIFDGTIDWDDAPNVTAVLLDDTYTPDAAVHATYADVAGAEIADADYVPQAVINRLINRVNYEIQYTSDPVSFGDNVTIGARYLVLVVGDPAGLLTGDALIGYVDFGEMKASTNAQYTYTPPATGWWRIQKA